MHIWTGTGIQLFCYPAGYLYPVAIVRYPEGYKNAGLLSDAFLPDSNDVFKCVSQKIHGHNSESAELFCQNTLDSGNFTAT